MRGAAFHSLYSEVSNPGGRAVTVPSTGFWPICANSSLFVMLKGSGSGAATSPDGINWTLRSLANSQGWNDITYGAGLFVAIGQGTSGLYSTNIYNTSPDGITWTSRTFPVTSTFVGIAFNGTAFIVTHYSGHLYSTNGTSWSSSAINIGTTVASNGIGFVGSKNGQPVRWSPNGVIWYTSGKTLQNVPQHGIISNGTVYVAMTDEGGNRPNRTVYSSSDGNSWTQISLLSDVYSSSQILASNGNKIITYSLGSYYTISSDNGYTWVPYAVPFGSWVGPSFGTSMGQPYATCNNPFIFTSGGDALLINV